MVESQYIRVVLNDVVKSMRACGYENAATMVELALAEIMQKEVFVYRTMDPNGRGDYQR